MSEAYVLSRPILLNSMYSGTNRTCGGTMRQAITIRKHASRPFRSERVGHDERGIRVEQADLAEQHVQRDESHLRRHDEAGNHDQEARVPAVQIGTRRAR